MVAEPTDHALGLSGYLGASVERRGYLVERKNRLWSLPELQELLNEWLVAQ